MTLTTSIVFSEALLGLLVLAAAVTDLRTGKIPNWLTLPAMVLGPVFWFFARGDLIGPAESVMGMFLCGLAPFMAYRSGGMPGGDLKLFVAVGALVGPVYGIEVQFFTMVAAGIFGIGVLIYRGQFRATFGQAWIRMRNKMVPEKWRREVPEVERLSVRIGPFVVVGAALLIVEHTMLWKEVLVG